MVDLKEARIWAEKMESQGLPQMGISTANMFELLDELENYQRSFEAFYKALECEDYDHFVSRLTPENCRMLGKAFADSVKSKLAERSKLLEVLKAVRDVWDELEKAKSEVEFVNQFKEGLQKEITRQKEINARLVEVLKDARFYINRHGCPIYDLAKSVEACADINTGEPC